MDALILSPPVTMPAEPASGAFALAAGLAGHGADVALLDLSLAFLHRALDDLPGPSIEHARRWLRQGPYTIHDHRSATGALHKRLKGFRARHPGWGLTLMDLTTPHSHDPLRLLEALAEARPFDALYAEVLDPALDRHRPKEALISLAYLSQLPGALDLTRHLRARGIEPIIGGSLPNSLQHTGAGFELIRRAFPRLQLGDGRALVAGLDAPLLSRMAWPKMLDVGPYLTPRPFIPLPLSTGCYWNRCLFCPDRGLDFVQLQAQSIGALFEGVPEAIRAARPVVHLLDSALPPARLRAFLPLARQHGFEFYGFARPTKHLLKGGLLEAAAESGCLMLQLGVEGGSGALLDRYDKGFQPDEAEAVVSAAHALGIRTYLYLLFGLPGETGEDRAMTEAMLKRLEGQIDFLNLSIFNLPSDSELTTRAAEFGIEAGEYGGGPLRLYKPFRCVDGSAPRDEARAFLAGLKDQPHARAPIRRTPRWMRAAHLALMPKV